jgi:hypothetical protein
VTPPPVPLDFLRGRSSGHAYAALPVSGYDDPF